MTEALQAAKQTANSPTWKPQPGPQTEAYNSDADVIGYGGEAGGGKTDLLLGFARHKSRRALLFRREFPRLEGIISRGIELFGKDGFNEQMHRWKFDDSHILQLAAMKDENDKFNFQGRAYDHHLFDEVTEFAESQFRFVTAWNRSTVSGQRCQVIVTFNPPMDESQEWVTRYFAPWLVPGHSHPAQDGELRYYAQDGDTEVERPDGEPFMDKTGRMITPKSRTFFHASLKDNPILEATGYASQIDALPEPLRSILRGNFAAGKIANPWQVIPSAWIKAAVERGKAKRAAECGAREAGEEVNPPVQTALGADIARGGRDKFVIAPLNDLVDFGELHKYPGSTVTDGPSGAALIISHRVGGCSVGVDVIGIGSSVFDSLVQLSVNALPVNFGEGTDLTDKSGQMQFRNVRSAAYWLFREALDPANGANVSLPDDPELVADLAAPRFKVVAGKIVVESKDEDTDGIKSIKSRLGRSPDCGDAVIIAWWTRLNGGPWYWE